MDIESSLDNPRCYPEKTIFVPFTIKSQNHSHKQHWSVYHKYKKSCFETMSLLLGSGKHYNRKRYCDITAYLGYNKQNNKPIVYDYANLVGGAKPIPDALKELGWIKDDNPYWFDCRYEQKQVGQDGVSEEGTRITLYWQESPKTIIQVLRQDGYSIRYISQELNISRSMVHRYLKTVSIETPQKIRGIDGKKYYKGHYC